MNKICFFFFLLSNMALAQIPILPTKPTPQTIIEQVRKKYAPDKRTAIFQVGIDSNRVVGKTNLTAAKKELIYRLKSNTYFFQDAIQTLPDEKELEGKTYAVVNISVANLRSQPKESAELASQTLLGTVLKVFDKEKYWYQVQTPDNYIGWVEGMTIKRLSKTEVEQYEAQTKLLYTKPYGFAYEQTNENFQTVSDLTWGDVLSVTDTLSDYYAIKYPDNRKGFVKKNEVISLFLWKKKLSPNAESLSQTAKRMMGIPYLWGGTSWKGVDCSGFTRMIFQTNGILLPRDASQQVWVGEEVDTASGFEKLQVGDLLFFGEKATAEKPEKVVHVGMWIGNHQFIHSSGMVKISSFEKESPLFDAYNLGRYLKTKRILGSNKGIVCLDK
jgi:cell wall-associated NlpC family hydrolase